MNNPLDRQTLEAGARSAVLVRRSDLPVPLAHPARSFFGGLPKLPADLDWPRAEVEGETVALTFIAQIDLADLPRVVASPLPQAGTLYYFCSSAFCGEGSPPCRVLFHPADAAALAAREPPPDLIALGGNDGEYQVKWLDPITGLHAKVEFKYPLSFLTFRDFDFHEDPVGGDLLIASLCQALGQGEPRQSDMLSYRRADDYAKDEDWPFNRLIMAYAARAILHHVRGDLEGSHRKPMSNETKEVLQAFAASADGWLGEIRQARPMDGLDDATKGAFRAWWIDLVRKYEGLRGEISVYPHRFPRDLGDVINHTIRHMATEDDGAVANAPRSYVANLERQNHWKTPEPRDGRYRSFSTAIHQILGYGSSWQDAPSEHRDDVLLLQLWGDRAFLGWHANIGCVLHFWGSRDAVSRRDFTQVEATFECD